VPGGVLGGVLGGQLGGQLGGVATKREPTQASAPKPFNVVVGNAIYKPDPDKNALAATKASMFDKRPGTNETSFCVDVDGKTVDVKTKKKFPNDPKVDEICRDTIKKWRFKPFIVGGKPVKTCSVAEFNLKFT
jgi:protein TonB